MVAYEQQILQQYAESLYRQARWIVFSTASTYGFFAFLFAVPAALMLSAQAREIPKDTWVGAILVVTLLGIGIGVSAGQRKALELRLRAQEILCQREIEMNTRGRVVSAPPDSLNPIKGERTQPTAALIP